MNSKVMCQDLAWTHAQSSKCVDALICFLSLQDCHFLSLHLQSWIFKKGGGGAIEPLVWLAACLSKAHMFCPSCFLVVQSIGVERPIFRHQFFFIAFRQRPRLACVKVSSCTSDLRETSGAAVNCMYGWQKSTSMHVEADSLKLSRQGRAYRFVHVLSSIRGKESLRVRLFLVHASSLFPLRPGTIIAFLSS